jgi:hypothetical protein
MRYRETWLPVKAIHFRVALSDTVQAVNSTAKM